MCFNLQKALNDKLFAKKKKKDIKVPTLVARHFPNFCAKMTAPVPGAHKQYCSV